MFAENKDLHETFLLEVTDNDIAAIKNFIIDGSFVPIKNIEQLLANPVHTIDINQKKIGNCYLLSALGSILESDPYYLTKIIKLNEEGAVEVTLHDTNDPNKIYIYKIDPTKVVSKAMNAHSSDLIFLLEKAYAIHRYMHTRKEQNPHEEKIVDELQKNKLDIAKVLEALQDKKLTKEYIADVATLHKLDYVAALTKGNANEAYINLLGVPTMEYYFGFQNNDYEFYLSTFINELIEIKMQHKPINTLATDVKNLALEIFSSLDSPEFMNFLDKMDFTVFLNSNQALEDITHGTKKLSKRKILIDFFMGIEGLEDSTKEKLQNYIKAHVAMPRGFGQYSQEQEHIYKLIKSQLIQGQFVTLSTKSTVGKKAKTAYLFSNEPISKGLAGNHAYQVVSAYQRNGLKYLLIRNPWGQDVRDYEKKQKYIDGHKVVVLRSKKTSQLHANDRILGVASFFSDTNLKNKYRNNGYFEIELTDLKRMKRLQSTDKKGGVFQIDNPENLLLINFLTALCENFMLQKGILPMHTSDNLLSLTTILLEHETAFIKNNMAIELYSVLTIYFNLINDEHQSNHYLKKLNKTEPKNRTWKLEDALEHIKIKYVDIIPEVEMLPLQQNKSPRSHRH